MSIESISVSGTAAQRTENLPQTARATAQVKNGGQGPLQTSAANAPRREDSSTQPGQPSRQDVDEAVNRLTDFVSANQSEINFSVDESSGIRVVKIVDRNSNEVIRQMPSEEAVALARALDKLQGLLIKDKA